MTRINCVDPSVLLDQHLFAEWRELPRIFKLARPVDNAPPEYVLGRGHVTFFYDKTKWLAERHAELTAELRRRHYQLTEREPLQPIPGLDGDWEPTIRDECVSFGRLSERLQAKEYGFYTFHKARAPMDWYLNAYRERQQVLKWTAAVALVTA